MGERRGGRVGWPRLEDSQGDLRRGKLAKTLNSHCLVFPRRSSYTRTPVPGRHPSRISEEYTILREGESNDLDPEDRLKTSVRQLSCSSKKSNFHGFYQNLAPRRVVDAKFVD